MYYVPAFDEEVGFSLRDYQAEAVEAVDRGFEEGKHRQLVIHATGTGKGSLVAFWAQRAYQQRKKLLFLAHRDSLIEQTANRIREQGQVDVAIEKGKEYACPTAHVVCASVQTLQAEHRLTGFSPDHFDVIIADESHRSMADTWMRILNYFHFGRDSLNEGWTMPTGEKPYERHASVIGLTATPDLPGEVQLGDWYQHIAHKYDLLDAVRDGWLVGPKCKSVPLKVDLRGLKAKRTINGSDISDHDLSQILYPILGELANQTANLASDRKTIAFLPSIDCAKIFAERCRQAGLWATHASGVEPEGLEVFRSQGRGSVLANAQLVVEGVDLPDVDCVAMYRGTKSRIYYSQAAGRASRPLKGLLDGISDPEERRQAIARSAKKEFLILDPLWVSDRLQLVKPYSLVAKSAAHEHLMEKSQEPDLEKAAREAERDLVKSLEKEAKKHRNKQSRIIDPLTYAVSLGEEILSSYEPNSALATKPAAEHQVKFLLNNGLGTPKTMGQADFLIQRVMDRERLGLATPRQLTLLRQIGLPEEEAVRVTKKKAGWIIGVKFRR